MERVREVTDNVIKILVSEEYKSKEKEEVKKELIEKEVMKVFDWEEFSRRTLAQHWSRLTKEQQKEFMELYKTLLRKVYEDRLEGYSGEKLVYEGEEVLGDRAVVKATVIGYKGADVPLQYRMIKKGADWFVYDVVIEGVSLVNNYRTQFNDIMIKSGYKGLIEAMNKKIREKEEISK